MTALIWIALVLGVPYVVGTAMGILLFWPVKDDAKAAHRRMDVVAAVTLLSLAGAGMFVVRAEWSLIPALLCFAFGAAVAYEGSRHEENPCLITHAVAQALCPLCGREKLPYVGWYED